MSATDYQLLERSIATTLYAWKNPPSLNAPADANLQERDRQMQQYFMSDPMAYHVWRSLVATAIRWHEWMNTSIEERQRKQAEQAIALERLLGEQVTKSP